MSLASAGLTPDLYQDSTSGPRWGLPFTRHLICPSLDKNSAGAFFCRPSSCFQYIIESGMLYVQKIRSVYRSVLRRWLRTSLAGQHGLYWQWDVSHWLCTYWLGCSRLSQAASRCINRLCQQ